MRRWLYVWGPPLLGVGLASVFGSCAVASALGAHWLLLPPACAGSAVALIAAIYDIGRMNPSGPAARDDTFKSAPCRGCLKMADKCMGLERDRDELREAIAVLQLPESRP